MRYEKRQKFFAVKVIRSVSESLLVSQIGADAFVLLVTVALQEDKLGYIRPVNFWNNQLVELCGFKSERQLIAARKRAVDSGWLEYDKGFKSIPARYRCVIPCGKAVTFPVNYDSESSGQTQDNFRANSKPPSLTLTLTHKESQEEDGDGDLDKEREVVSISPEDEWKMVRLESWAKTLAPLCGTLKPGTWQRYKGLVDQYGLEMVAIVAKNNSGRWVWPDDLAAILATCKADVVIPEDPDTSRAIVILKAKGWQQAVDHVGLSGVSSEQEAIAECRANPGLVAELLEWANAN